MARQSGIGWMDGMDGGIVTTPWYILNRIGSHPRARSLQGVYCLSFFLGGVLLFVFTYLCQYLVGSWAKYSVERRLISVL